MPLGSPCRVQETATVTGTGDVTLGGAVTSWRTFAADLSVGSLVEYAVAGVDANGNDNGEYEFGLGTLSGATTLQRTSPLGGSSALPVNFAAGAKRAIITLLGTTAMTQTQWFGDGSDGDAVVTSTITLTRDTYYNNLTMGAAGIINTAGYRLHVAGVLLDTGNVAGAIRNNGSVGGVGGTATGGTAGPAGQSINVGGGGAGSAGGAGATGAGAQAPAPTTSGTNNGGIGGSGGAGGLGSGGAGGIARPATSPLVPTTIRRLTDTLNRLNITITGGVGAPGGSGGGGDGTTTGTGGGGGGAGAGVVWLAARIISTTGSTPAGWISANGGSGGNGRPTANSGNTGGGGGGAGGGGGWVYLVYQARVGSPVTGLIAVDGGLGGDGGPGAGTGIGGNGGRGGACGRVTIVDLMTGITEPVVPGSQGAAVTAATTTAGTTGSAGSTGRATL